MTNDATDVNDLINSLRDGSMSLEQVAQRFRERTWPATKPQPPTNYLELAAEAMQDPGTHVPGSYDDVVAAFDRGELSEEEFDVLSEAVAESKRAKH